jgi:hypothetical protein
MADDQKAKFVTFELVSSVVGVAVNRAQVRYVQWDTRRKGSNIHFDSDHHITVKGPQETCQLCRDHSWQRP